MVGDGGATLLLLSDGHANVGITDGDKLGAVAADARGHRSPPPQVTIPVNVNVVPGDEAAGRMANPVVSTERAFQQAQRDKQAATDALRAGEPGVAQQLFSSAAQTLDG